MNKKDPSWVQTLALIPPSLKDNTADVDRLLNALKSRLKSNTIHLDLELIRKIPEIIRHSDYRVQCTVLRDRNQWV